MEDNITIQDLFDKGFVRKKLGICGQDQWAGMDLPKRQKSGIAWSYWRLKT